MNTEKSIIPPLDRSRRHFFQDCGVGLGKIALAGLLADGSGNDRKAFGAAPDNSAQFMAQRSPHFPGKAKAVIHLFMAGAPQLIHLPEKELEFISKFSQILNLAKAEAITDELEKAHFHIERNANPKILFLDVSLKLVKILKFNTLPKGTHNILL